MKNDDEQSSLMLAVIGIIPVIWFALLVAPYLSSGLMGILDGVPEAMAQPTRYGSSFSISKPAS